MSRASSERGRRGWGRALVGSAVVHALALGLLLGVAHHGGETPPVPVPPPAIDIDLGEPTPAPPGAKPEAAVIRPRAPAGTGRRATPRAPTLSEPSAPSPQRGGVDLSLQRDPTIGAGGAPPRAPPPGSLLAPPAPPEPARPRARELPRTQKRPGFIAHVDDDGAVHFENRFPRDANDALMRMLGMDPYSYEKRRFAEETRPARQRMADAARVRWQAEALTHLPAMLERVWQNRSQSAAARRSTLFDLWDECLDADGDAEAPGDPTDAAVTGAARARRVILDFIRSRLPAGSPDAYTPAEIDTLNRRRSSRERFSPYAP
jgi:hypothetical protein